MGGRIGWFPYPSILLKNPSAIVSRDSLPPPILPPPMNEVPINEVDVWKKQQRTDPNGEWKLKRDHWQYGTDDNVLIKIPQSPPDIKLDIEYIWGPVSFYYFKIPKFNKKIILMSDRHTRLVEHIPWFSAPNPIWEKSMIYDEFIVKLIDYCQTKDRCVDFYLEQHPTIKQSGLSIEDGNKLGFLSDDDVEYNTSDHRRLKESVLYEDKIAPRTSNSYNQFLFESHQKYISPWRLSDLITRQYFRSTLTAARVLFSNCGLQEYGARESCEILKKTFNNLRVHNVDTRGDHFDTSIQLAKDISPDDYSVVLEWYLGIHDNDEKVRPLMYNDATYEEVKAIRSSMITKITKFHTKSELDEIKKAMYKCNVSESGIKKIDLNFRTSIMDLYTITRMLKTFKMDGNKRMRGPLQCRDSPNQDRIIVYAGIAHVENYVCMLESLYPGSLKFSVPESNLKILGVPIRGKYEWMTSKCIAYDNCTIHDRYSPFNDFEHIAEDFCLKDT